MKTLSLVVPVYESPDLARTLLEKVPELEAAASANGFRLVETMLVDDGSSTPLADALVAPSCVATATSPSRHCELKVLRNEPNRGKGYSVKRGALAAKGEWVLMSDVDLSAPLGEFAKLAPKASAWMVCGSRYGRPGMPLKRKFLSWLFHVSVWLAGVRGIHDTQCGFKLFRMDVMRPVFEQQRIDRFAFDVELIRNTQRAGGEVVEVPVEWQGGKRSSLKVFKDAPRMLWDLLMVRFVK